MKNYQNQDHYAVLQVNRMASHDEIKKTYRKLAHKHHPDKNHDKTAAKEMLIQINLAWEVLGDADKRANYDMFGSSNAFDFQQRQSQAEKARAEAEAQQRAAEREKIQKLKDDFIIEICKFYGWSRNSERAQDTYNDVKLNGVNRIKEEINFYKKLNSYWSEINALGLQEVLARYEKCNSYFLDSYVDKNAKRSFHNDFDNQPIAWKSEVVKLFRHGGESAVNSKIPHFEELVKNMKQ